jgi:cytochrome P450
MQKHDPPRYVIVSARVSPMVELARWLFERAQIRYEEEGHAPLIHALFTKRRRGGVEVPVVVTAASVWKGAHETLTGLDSRLRSGERLFGDTPSEREANAAFVQLLLKYLLLDVRRFAYFHLLPFKRTVLPVVTDGVPAWERAVVWLFYPIWRRLLGRALDFSPSAIEAAPRNISAAFDLVEAELERRGTRFLGGDAPSPVDIIFSALVAPVVLPEGYGSTLPTLESLPPALRTFVDQWRTRPAGHLVFATYERARPTPQPLLRRPRRNQTLLQRLLSPRVQRFGARAALRLNQPLVFRKFALVTRWRDVNAVLESDLHFLIAPVNGPRFDVISGPFVLGLDRGEQFARERSAMYRAVSQVNLDQLRERVRQEARSLLAYAVERDGRIDVGHGYAHLVAARTATYLFGIRGPTEADLLRVCRALFHYSFLDQGNDPAVADRARDAAGELRTWTTEEIVRRRRGDLHFDDVLGRLMRNADQSGAPLDDDAVRRNVGGLLVGAIDTTTTTLARIVYVLASDPTLLKQAERDVDDTDRMRGWCWEALRMWPSAPEE